MFRQEKLGEFDFIEDRAEVVECLGALRLAKEKLWLWQEKPGEHRKIHFGIIKRLVEEKNLFMLFSGQPGIHFGFESDNPVYVYSQEQKIAFQTQYQNVENEFINLEIPLKVGLLTKEQCEKLSVIEIENESAHRHKREHERKHPEANKTVRVEKIGQEEDDSGSSAEYALYDMSQGGISFRIQDPSLFQVGERVKFSEIDQEPLGKELYGTIRSIRWIEEDSDEAILKVGVKFDDV